MLRNPIQILAQAFMLCAGMTLSAAAKEYKQGDQIGHYVIGEKLSYSIHWGPLQVGTGSFSTHLHTHETLGKLIQLRFSSQGSGLANKVYPVDDCIDSFISPETLQPLYVVKKTKEGDFICDSTLSFNYDLQEVQWEDRQNKTSTNYPISGITTDFYSLLHSLRSQSLSEGEPQRRQVAVDDKTHEVEITLGKSKTLKVKGRGKTPCQEVEISALTEGLFVKKVPSDIWITTEAPHVLASMKIKVPVGSVKIKFESRELNTPIEADQSVEEAPTKDEG